MSAYKDYYLVKVEKLLGRELSEEEKEEIKPLYIQGWHPQRVVDYILNK